MRGTFLVLSVLVGLGCQGNDPEGRVGLKTGFVRLEDSRLYYEEMGSGQPVIMIHGGFLDRRMWDAQFDLFAEKFRVIRYDVRAHGRSGGADSAFLDHEDLFSLVRHLGIENAAVIGHSMGGQIAVDFAIVHPERVRALILAGPGMSGYNTPHSEEGIGYLEDVSRARNEDDFEEAIAVFARAWVEGPFRSATEVNSALREKVQTMLAGSKRRWDHLDMVSYLDPPAIGRLEEIRCPLLAVVGQRDMPEILEIVRLYSAGVPGAREPIILDAGHMISMERSEEFGRAAIEFLESVYY